MSPIWHGSTTIYSLAWFSCPCVSVCLWWSRRRREAQMDKKSANFCRYQPPLSFPFASIFREQFLLLFAGTCQKWRRCACRKRRGGEITRPPSCGPHSSSRAYLSGPTNKIPKLGTQMQMLLALASTKRKFHRLKLRVWWFFSQQPPQLSFPPISVLFISCPY